ncbi:hypothetical protein AMK27_38195 [Streptomyces sp. CB02009]|uniref:hypothetical protein n=1 Tax=Streptomyces sp. CB02009 TaxID=1703938 RepID=UPI000938B910|nr:hypothetical protein [Streptomyces sp. CB02009]OKJ48608.1 hypothetical protein AMK27_38195 [Streptomyces sp. CB02009]
MGDHRRVYGSEPDEGQGPDPGRAYVELVGGPLDGMLVYITGWAAADIADGAALITEAGAFDPGGRALYEPLADGAPTRWEWAGDTS